MNKHRPLLILVFTAIAACGRVDPAAELAAAKEELASGDLKTAAIRLSTVLQAEPTNVEALILRGELALSTDDYATAVAELDRARSLGVPPERVAMPLAEAAARLGSLEQANDSLQGAMSALETEPSYWLTRADVALLAGKQADAASALSRAEQLGGVGTRYSVARSRLLALRGDSGAAVAVLEAAVSQDPSDGEARAILGELYAKANRLEDATTQLEAAADRFRAAGRTAFEARALLSLVQVHVAQNDLDSASSAADRLAQRLPQTAIASYVRGLVEYRQGRFDAAATDLQTAVNAAPDTPQFLTLLGAVDLAQGNLGQAEQHLLRVLSSDPRDPAAVKLLAETRLRQQRPDAALDALRVVASVAADDAQIGLLTGVANVQAGNAEQGVVYLEQAAALDPGNQMLKLELAKAYLAAGRDADATKLLDRGFDTGVSGSLSVRLVQLLAFARSGDLQAGERAVASLLEQRPNDPQALMAAAVYRQAVNQPKEAREQLERAVSLDGKLVPARLLLAGALVQEGRAADAEEQLRQVLALEPDNAQALTVLARLALSRNDASEAERLLIRAASGTSATLPRLALVQLYLAEGRLKEANEQLRRPAQTAPDDPEVIATRGLLALAEGRPADAIALLTTAESRLPERLNVALALAEAHVRNGQPASARSVLRAVLMRAPESLPLRMALGLVELRMGESEEALSIAKALQAEFPRQQQGYVLEARVDVAHRRYDAAAAVLRVANTQEPTWAVLAELSNTLQLAGKTDDAIDVLNTWISEAPMDARARLTLASLFQQVGRPRDALSHYEAVLKSDGDNVVALNNAAWLYHTLGEGQALSLAQHAYALAPQSAAVLDTLGTILLQGNRAQDAIGHLENATQLAPESLEIRYHLAEAQAKLGRRSEAKVTLESLLGDARPFEERAAAQALLKTL
jgi:putative PEP-CTERM system TPR-repeat lipoprotein